MMMIMTWWNLVKIVCLLFNGRKKTAGTGRAKLKYQIDFFDVLKRGNFFFILKSNFSSVFRWAEQIMFANIIMIRLFNNRVKLTWLKVKLTLKMKKIGEIKKSMNHIKYYMKHESYDFTLFSLIFLFYFLLWNCFYHFTTQNLSR